MIPRPLVRQLGAVIPDRATRRQVWRTPGAPLVWAPLGRPLEINSAELLRRILEKNK